jgi:hypothetical protein
MHIQCCPFAVSHNYKLFTGSSRGFTFLHPRTETSVVSLDLSSALKSDIEMPTRPFGNVAQLRYLGGIIEDQNYIQEEIKCRVK